MKFTLMVFSIIVLRCCWGPSNYQLMLQQNDDTASKVLSGAYIITHLNNKDVSSYNLTIAFDSTNKKVSGFSGCNRFFGSYSLLKNNLNFSGLGSTKKLCEDEANTIESEFLKIIEASNSVLFKKDGFSFFNKKKLLLTAVKKAKEPSVSFEYSAITRGSSQLIKINKKSISLVKQHKGKHKTIACSDADWNKLIKSLESVEVENIPNLKAPSQKRLFDGAAIAKLKITVDGKTYETPSFDHGNPPKDIAPLVKEILSISENIE